MKKVWASFELSATDLVGYLLLSRELSFAL
jgi:hypothetical protein